MKISKNKPLSPLEAESIAWQWLETPLGPMLAKWRYLDREKPLREVHTETRTETRTEARTETQKETHIKRFYLAGLWFKDQKYFPSNAPASYPISTSAKTKSADCPEIFIELEQCLSAYFLGAPNAWEYLGNIPLLPEGSEFQKNVWSLLLQVPYGQTSTYGQLAKEIAQVLKRPSFSAQAVGGAVGRNPISILIPCHRIVGAKGALTGYAGGIDKKTQLLQLENAMIPEANPR